MATPITGQVAVSSTAQPLSFTHVDAQAFTIKAPVTNSAAVFIGPAGVTTGNGYQLDPGDVFEYEVSSQHGRPTYQLTLGDLYVIGTGGSVSWIASP